MSERREFKLRWSESRQTYDVEYQPERIVSAEVTVLEVLPGDLSPEESDKLHETMSYEMGIRDHKHTALVEAARAVATNTYGYKDGSLKIDMGYIEALRAALENEDG